MSERGTVWFDLIVATVLGIASLGAAWSGYQCVRWSGRQAQGYSKSDELRASANRAASVAINERSMDVENFSSWLDAYVGGHPELADFYRKRFRPEFRPAFEEWLAMSPRKNPAAPPSPFVLPSYALAADAEAHRLLDEAAAVVADANASNEQGDRYQLLTVTFSIVLFLAGVVTPLRTHKVRVGLLVMTILLLAYCGFKLAIYPVE